MFRRLFLRSFLALPFVRLLGLEANLKPGDEFTAYGIDFRIHRNDDENWVCTAERELRFEKSDDQGFGGWVDPKRWGNKPKREFVDRFSGLVRVAQEENPFTQYGDIIRPGQN